MHELSIAQNIVEVALESLPPERPNAVITHLTLEVGVLSGVVKECLEFAFPEVTRGTPLADCVLTIETIPLKLTCQRCSQLSTCETITMVCSHCGSRYVEIITGKELMIKKMEVK